MAARKVCRELLTVAEQAYDRAERPARGAAPARLFAARADRSAQIDSGRTAGRGGNAGWSTAGHGGGSDEWNTHGRSNAGWGKGGHKRPWPQWYDEPRKEPRKPRTPPRAVKP